MSSPADDGVGFCPDPLWDRSVTWDTQDPYFTRCFHETGEY